MGTRGDRSMQQCLLRCPERPTMPTRSLSCPAAASGWSPIMAKPDSAVAPSRWPGAGRGGRRMAVAAGSRPATGTGRYRSRAALRPQPRPTPRTARPSRTPDANGHSPMTLGSKPRPMERVGASYWVQVMRPARTHGSAHRGDLVARSSQAAPGQRARWARAAAPAPRRGAGGGRCNGRHTRPVPTAAASSPRSASDPRPPAEPCPPSARRRRWPAAPAPACAAPGSPRRQRPRRRRR